jgi:ABC-2 type transport system ATP-binding protein
MIASNDPTGPAMTRTWRRASTPARDRAAPARGLDDAASDERNPLIDLRPRQTVWMAFPPPTVPPLRVRGLTKRFGETLALDRLSLDVPAGSCFGLVGPNGSGKSTTLRSVIGLVRPDEGDISVCGFDVVTHTQEARRSMGVVLDPLQLFERLSAREFVATLGDLRGLDAATVATRSEQLFTSLGLIGDADRQISGYSHGMRKKTSLAAAMLHRPRLLLLDEPFEGVDPVSARAMRAMLDRFRAGGGTVVFSSHVMDLVERLCDHVGVIAQGRVVAVGPIDELSGGRRLEDVFIDVVGGDVGGDTGLDWLD